MEERQAPAARVRSVQVGRLRPLGGPGAEVRSGIDKRPLAGGTRLLFRGFEGDEIADQEFHGGADQAGLLFAASHYPAFEARLGPLPPGSFGENVTVEGLDEGRVCVGDVFRLGGATIRVTTSRAPCGSLARHLRDPGIVEAIRAPHRAGWYVRTLEEGHVSPGDEIALVERPNPGWSVERVAAVRLDKADLEGARALAAVPGLAEASRAALVRRLRAPR